MQHSSLLLGQDVILSHGGVHSCSKMSYKTQSNVCEERKTANWNLRKDFFQSFGAIVSIVWCAIYCIFIQKLHSILERGLHMPNFNCEPWNHHHKARHVSCLDFYSCVLGDIDSF